MERERKRERGWGNWIGGLRLILRLKREVSLLKFEPRISVILIIIDTIYRGTRIQNVYL